jgi:predicted amidophosphoribosyltransferase
MEPRAWDRIAERRCRWCSDDSVGEDLWVPVGPARRGGVACWRCAAAALDGRLALSATVAAYRGRGAALHAVARYKEKEEGWKALEAPLVEALAASVAELMASEGLPSTTVVVPVPSYRGRRPHVQALTSLLSGIHVRSDLLHKRQDIRQVGAGRRRRWEQSHGAYGVGWRHLFPGANSLRGRTVIVTDDIYTTGATLNACAAALRAAGAREVYGATILRLELRPPHAPVVSPAGGQIRVRFTPPDAHGMLTCHSDQGCLWVRFACEPHCPYILTAGPLPLPTPHIDVETTWLCRCGLEHPIQIARVGPMLRVTVPPRRPARFLLALQFPQP